MAAYEEINIGPFVGGLNSLSDQTSIGDTELFQCTNFELDQDGSLVSRPPVRQPSTNAIPGTTKGVKILGYFVDSAQTVYLIASNMEGATYYYASGNWTLITATFAATACCQYRDKLYLVAPLTSSNPGGTWTVAGGFVADAAMPKGVAIVSNKDRLWVCQGASATSNGSRVYVTDIVSGAPAWQGNFITASGGDGQNVVDIAVYNADIIIFKQSSTYRFAFGSDVATGYFSTLSSTVGLNSTGCWVSNEQQLYVVSNNNVYEFTNYIFNRLNLTVPLKANNPSASLFEKTSISVWADRLFVSYYDSLFVYNLKNRTWSKWQSDRVVSFGRFFPVPFQQAARPIAFLYSTQPLSTAGAPTASAYIYQIVNIIEAGTSTDIATSEQMSCTFETKNYDYQSPSRFKRLKMWGADVDLRNNITVTAQPVLYAKKVTWGEVRTRTWGAAKAYTWGRPTDPDVAVAETISVAGIAGGKKFVKFMKSLRFRQISYKGVATCNGITDDSPVRVYKLSTYVKEKELISAKIN